MAMLAEADDIGAFHDARSLIESRTTPLAGSLILIIATLVVALVGWTAWARVDQVVRAAGQVEPAGRVKVINHPRGGRVAEILVTEGQRVVAGQPLVRLDAEIRQDEYAALLGRLQLKQMDVARLRAESDGTPLALEAGVAAARPDLVASEMRLMAARADAYAARHETLERAVEARRGELRTAGAELGRLRNASTLLGQQLEAVTQLADRGLYPKLKLFQLQQQVSDSQGEVRKTEAGLAAAQAALAEGQSRLAGFEKDWHSQLLTELSEATAARDQLQDQSDGQRGLLDGLVVRAPVAGVVQDLAVAAPGQSVGANEPLMKLVPTDEGLVVQARVANDDIGGIRLGLPATIKVRTFDFLRHGVLNGHVVKIAADASPEPGKGAPSYLVVIATDRDHLGPKPGDLEVAAGMVVDVEVKTGERTILSYLTERIWRVRDAAFRDG
jgi:HlyD family type I secretion membrane fusion protein